MTLIGLIIIFHSGIFISQIPSEYKQYIFSIVFLCDVLIPLTFLPALYLFKNVQHHTLSERRERIVPLFFSTVCFYIGYYIISRYAAVRIISLFLLSGVAVLLMVLIVSVFWKISLHMAGLGGITGLILALSYAYSLDMTIYLSLALFISGTVASARLVLNCHSLSQIAAGYVTGAFIVFGFLALFIK
jgi:hypothetical protein